MVPFQYEFSMTSKICLFLLFVTQIGTITCQDTETCVLIGSSWYANCTTYPVNEEFIVWKKDGLLLEEYSKQPTIQIYPIDQSHAGIYVCMNIDSLIIYSTHKLTPYRPIKLVSPTSYQINIGDDLNIYCQATGIPELTYSWFRYGVLLGSGTDTYSITNATVSDTGVYECQISNECTYLELNIEVTIYRPIALAEGFIIGIVIGLIFVAFLCIICVFVSLVHLRKFLRHQTTGSKSGSNISSQPRLRRKRSFASSSHRNSISDMFVQEGVIHENPVFSESAANEMSAKIGNLIGIPQLQSDLDKISHLSLGGSTTGGKSYSSDDLDLKPIEKPDLNTTDVRRSKSLSYSRVPIQEYKPKLAPYEHRFSPGRTHRYQSKPLEFSPQKVSKERIISEVVAKKRKIFDQPESEPSPPKYSTIRKLGQSAMPELVPKPRKTVFLRKISLDDELSVTPGDLADFLTNEMAANESDSDEELVAPLPIRMPHSTETRQVQEDTFFLQEVRKVKPELSWDELDKHFHVLDTFVTSGATRHKRASGITGTKPVPNLESIAEESPSMIRLVEEVSRVAVKKRQNMRQKVSHIDERDPWAEGDISYIPTEIVATRSKKFDNKTLY